MSLALLRTHSRGSEEILDFRYAPLLSARTGIRLVQLLPGSGNRGIAISLVDSFVSGQSQEPYDALSYTWGDVAHKKTILCNRKRLTITRTLLEALQRFRDPDRVVTLWIDQICIWQDNVRERNQQVQMMGEIYRAARKVIVWLGDDYEDSRSGMQLAGQLLHIARHQNVSGLGPGDLQVHGLPKRGHRRWKALAAIMQRPWFWRTWVVQEAVLNPHVVLVLGSASLTWEELESVVALLEGPLPKVWQLDQAISASELPFSRINRIRLRHRRLIAAPITSPNSEVSYASELSAEPDSMAHDDYEDDPELLDLLLMSRGLGATDPRDKVYALLGLGTNDIEADYSMSPESVFTGFALQIIGGVTDKFASRVAAGLELSSYEREVRRAMVLLACAGRQNQNLDLPSWVPDWTVNLASRPLIFGLGPGTQRFQAGGSKLGTFDWHYDSGLQLGGILLDTVQSVGIVSLESEGEGDARATIASWWEEAHQIASKRIATTPGSTVYTDAFESVRRRLSICKHGYYTGETRRKDSLLNDAETGSDDSAHSTFQTLTLGPSRGRVMCASGTGYLGLVPHGTREGDMIYIIRGADVPYILRPYGDAYELIGEAYIQGVMYGQALEMTHLLSQDIMIR